MPACLKRVRWLAANALAAAVALGALLTPRAVAAAEPPVRVEPGADLFSPDAPVLKFQIRIERAGFDSLRQDARKYVPATVTVGAAVFTNVAVHLKGAAGSFRPIDDQPALTLSFGKFVAGQRFHGLHKIHLNNSVQDPSFSTENICGGMFHAAGVPAPRVTNARVSLNGRDLGFYVLIEGFTRDFLGRYFEKTGGNLYDGGFLRDVDQTLDKESGDASTDQSDLRALTAAAEERDPAKRWERLGKVLDVDRFISFVALDVLLWDWDGYAMKRNNYRIYHDPATDKLVFIPHGMDQMFWDADGPLRPNFEGLVARAIVETPEGSRRYRQRMGELFERVYRLETLTNRVEQLYRRNRPVVAELGRDAVRNYDYAVADLRERIVNRWSGIQRQLAAEPPELRFTNGLARVAGWQERDAGGNRLDRISESGKLLLHIGAAGNCTASWRVKVPVEAGRFRFQGLARTAHVAPLNDRQKGEGAGLRLSGTTRPRVNKLSGDAPWTQLEFEFEVPPEQHEVELICELRATKGEVWFDAESLELARLK